MLVIRPFFIVVFAFVVPMWLRVNMHIRETLIQCIHTRTLLEKDETPEREYCSLWNEVECEREKACEKDEEEKRRPRYVYCTIDTKLSDRLMMCP